MRRRAGGPKNAMLNLRRAMNRSRLDGQGELIAVSDGKFAATGLATLICAEIKTPCARPGVNYSTRLEGLLAF